MSSATHRPQIGDKLWDESRLNEGKQPNGRITWINWEDREAMVRFHDEKPHWKKKLARLGYKFRHSKPKVFTFSDLKGNWNSRYKIYFIHEESIGGEADEDQSEEEGVG